MSDRHAPQVRSLLELRPKAGQEHLGALELASFTTAEGREATVTALESVYLLWSFSYLRFPFCLSS